MNKRFFALMFSAAMLMQNTSVLHAEDSFEIDAWIPDDEIPVESEAAIKNDEVYYPNDMGEDDEGSLAQGINVEYHSVSTILQYYRDHAPQFLDTRYSSNPSTTSPFAAGELTGDTLNDALETVNLIRFIAGLNNDVTLFSDYTDSLQAGSLLNAINNKLSHKPAKPADISDALYTLGYNGTDNANLAYGYSSLGKAITDSWLNDGNSSAISTLENRRWLLNSAMAKTGFGQVGSYSGMYSHDTSRVADATSNMWPAQNTPVEFFGTEYPWSVSTGNVENINSVEVTMENQTTKTSPTYFFSKPESDGDFYVNNDDYGTQGAIIWRPQNVTYSPGDIYKITITGLVGEDIIYYVQFFSFADVEETVEIDPAALELEVGETKQAKVVFKPVNTVDTVSMVSCNSTYVQLTKKDENLYNLKGVKPGRINFKVLTDNEIVATCVVTVKGLRISPEKATVEAGQSVQYQYRSFLSDSSQAISWASSDDSIATVTADGLVRTKKAGTVTITVSSGDYSASSILTVTASSITGITISPETLTVEHNKTSQLTASITPAGATAEVTWSSSNENVATVDSNGVVTGHAAGTATITASAGGYTATATVTVPEYIFINSRSAALEEKIQARIYVYVPESEVDTTYITTTFNGTSKTEYAKTMETAVRSGRTCRLVTVDTFAKQMRDDIVVKVHEEDGTPKYLEYNEEDVTAGYVFHVEDYVKAVEENATDADLIDLVRKMNWYGLYAQQQFNYNPVTFEEPAVITNFNDSVLSSYAVQNTGTANGITYTSGSLQLDSDTGIKVNYTLTGTDSISNYTFTVDGKTVTPVLVSGKRYCVTFTGIPAKKLNEWHTITVTDKNGNTLTTKYCGLTYTYSVVSNASAPDTLKDLCRSIYLYWEAADKYFNK